MAVPLDVMFLDGDDGGETAATAAAMADDDEGDEGVRFGDGIGSDIDADNVDPITPDVLESKSLRMKSLYFCTRGVACSSWRV